MQDTMTNENLTDLDLTKVAALQQKRTLAFVNHFVTTTAQFLNGFARSCEERLMQFERKLEKVNATMVLLEAKLSSIPEVNAPSEQKESQANVAEPKIESPEKPVDTAEVEVTKPDEPKNETAPVNPEYDRFVKMVHVGVPLDAVKLKVALEGLDPKELDKIFGK